MIVNFNSDEYAYQYDMRVSTENGNLYQYVIEADNLEDAIKVTEEFFQADYFGEFEIEEIWCVGCVSCATGKEVAF